MKVINFIHLKSDSLINIGDSYIVVSIGDEDNQDNDQKNKQISPQKTNSQDSNNFNRCVTDNNYSLHLKIYSGQLKIEPR